MPDLTQTEQITVVVGCVSRFAPSKYLNLVVKHLLEFCSVTGLTGKELFEFILTLMEKLKLDMNNLRRHGYDNEANRRGKHMGLQ